MYNDDMTLIAERQAFVAVSPYDLWVTAAPLDLEPTDGMSMADRAYVAIRDRLITLGIRPNEPIDDDRIARDLGTLRLRPLREVRGERVDGIGRHRAARHRLRETGADQRLALQGVHRDSRLDICGPDCNPRRTAYQRSRWRPDASRRQTTQPFCSPSACTW